MSDKLKARNERVRSGVYVRPDKNERRRARSEKKTRSMFKEEFI